MFIVFTLKDTFIGDIQANNVYKWIKFIKINANDFSLWPECNIFAARSVVKCSNLDVKVALIINNLFLLMKQIRLLGFIVLAPLLCFIACKKSAPGQPPAYLSYQLKNYFDYKVGSYWLYRDTVSGATDSFEVYSYVDDTAKLADVSTETVTISMIDYTISNSALIDSAEWDYTLQQNNCNLRYNSLPTNSSAFHSLSYSPFTQGMPFKLGTATVSNSNCGATSYGINFLPYYTIDTNVVGANTYSNLYQVHYQSASSSCSPSSINDWMYITQNFGLVKMNINNQYLHKVLELTYCHIKH